MKIDLNLKLNEFLDAIDFSSKPNLFLHSCCAPCSTAVLDKLSKYFKIYIIYSNDNIDTEEEFNKRCSELKKYLNLTKQNIDIIYDRYNHEKFLQVVNGLETEPEGGRRCEKCFKLRLKCSFDVASEFITKNKLELCDNYLCSTLSISPHKNAELLYEIGCEICNNSNLNYLPNDFKKENGYLKSVQISKQYSIYRQEYCGCEFAKMHKTE